MSQSVRLQDFVMDGIMFSMKISIYIGSRRRCVQENRLNIHSFKVLLYIYAFLASTRKFQFDESKVEIGSSSAHVNPPGKHKAQI